MVNKSTRKEQTSAKAKLWKRLPSCCVKMHTVYLFIVGWTVTSSALNSSRVLTAEDHGMQWYTIGDIVLLKF